MSIIVLNTKVLIQVSIFTSADPPPTHPLHGHSSHAKG